MASESVSDLDNEDMANNESMTMNRDLMARNRELMQTIKDMDHRIADMETKIEKQGDEIGVLNQRLVSVDVSESKLAAFNKNSVHTPASPVVLDGNDNRVAFLVRLIDTDGVIILEQGAVVFDHIFLNMGGHYNDSNGKFTAPTRGIYLFSATLLSPVHHDVRASITVNDKPAVSIFGYGSGGQRASGTQVAVLDLIQNDQVSLVTNTSLEYPPWGGEPYNSFSGVLLSPY